MLSLKHLQDKCLLHSQGSKQCRYLEQDNADYQKYYCRKLRTSDKNKIDKKVNEVLLECHKKKVSPASQGIPIGDNCAGYPLLKYVEQGYDKP